mmetsp:Transcript_11678/g.20998  ORF Transcript_11678/g.20998 Transcript_11678/m.20998 type:complete len:738 (-) Transcript_11678:76-2289(-)
MKHTEEELLELSGEALLESVKELNLRNENLISFDSYAERLPSLEALSLSHNLIASLDCFSKLPNLTSLNLNYNSVVNLNGLSGCVRLQQLFLSSNKIKDITPLMGLPKLSTLHLFRNQLSDIDHVLNVLINIPFLREVDLGGNLCMSTVEQKYKVIYTLGHQLDIFNGDSLTDVDFQQTEDFYKDFIPPFHPQLLTESIHTSDVSPEDSALEAPRGNNGSSISSSATNILFVNSTETDIQSFSNCKTLRPISGSERISAMSLDPNTTISQRSSTSTLTLLPSNTVSNPLAPSPIKRESIDLTSSLQRPTTPAMRTAMDLRTSLSTSTTINVIGGKPPLLRVTMGSKVGPLETGSKVLNHRPGTAPAFRLQEFQRGSQSITSVAGTSSSNYAAQPQLYSNNWLNDHPLLLEYLARHVLGQGAQLVYGNTDTTLSNHGRKTCSNISNEANNETCLPNTTTSNSNLTVTGENEAKTKERPPQSAQRGSSSFARRLRETAAVMEACEGLNAEEMARRQSDLLPSIAASRVTAAEEFVSASSPQDLMRQLVKLCEILIKEVELSRQKQKQTASGSSTLFGLYRKGSDGSSNSLSAMSSYEAPSSIKKGHLEVFVRDTASPPLSEVSVKGSENSLKEAEGKTVTPQKNKKSDNREAETGEALIGNQFKNGGTGIVSLNRRSSSGTTEATSSIPTEIIEELETLRREVKALRIESGNVFWLADEVKRLKEELKSAKEQIEELRG